MSLFDLDHSGSASSASSSASEEGVLPSRAPPPRSTGSASGTGTGSSGGPHSSASPLSALEQRRRMAERDAADWRIDGTQWRGVLLGSAPLSSSAPPRPRAPSGTAAPSADEGGKFGSSIAAALHLRQEEREQTLLRRLQQQRKAEAEGSEGRALAEKDMEVGVFVTPSYKALLQRNLHPTDTRGGDTANAGALHGGSAARDGNGGRVDGDGDEEDDGPLAAYLRQLESRGGTTKVPTAAAVTTAAGAPSPGDYYDRVMKAPLLEERVTTTTAQTQQVRAEEPEAPADITAIRPASITVGNGADAVPEATPPPTLAELEELLAGGAVTGSAPGRAPRRTSEAGGAHTPASRTDEEHSAVLAHAQIVFDAREARSRRGTTAATLVAGARRCDERIAASLFLAS